MRSILTILLTLCLLSVSAQSIESMSKRQYRKAFASHIVNHGETAFSIAKRYGISLTVLSEDNPSVDITKLSIGTTLNIRREQMGKFSEQQIKDSMQEVAKSANWHVHTVKAGETLYSIARMYDISESVLLEANIITNGLKAGMMLTIPGKGGPVEQNLGLMLTIPDNGGVEVPPMSAVQDGQFSGSPIALKTLEQDTVASVSLLLPLSASSGATFLDLYQGVLIGLSSLKKEGYSLELHLYDLDKSDSVAQQIVSDRAFEGTDLIIGSVYPESMPAVIKYAESNCIPVVSPLVHMDFASSALFQMAPAPETKTNKLVPLLTEEKNIVVVTMEKNDEEFVEEIEPLLPLNAKRITYSRGMGAAALGKLLDRSKENVFVVQGMEEMVIEDFLTRLSSVQNNLVARSIKNPMINIIGTSRWQRFANIEKNLFFKLNLSLVTSYNSSGSRSDSRVLAFDKEYISAFGTMPTLMSYRGYDAIRLFVKALYSGDMQEGVNSDIKLLQTQYHFEQLNNGSFDNQEWTLVQYRENYTIEVR